MHPTLEDVKEIMGREGFTITHTLEGDAVGIHKDSGRPIILKFDIHYCVIGFNVVMKKGETPRNIEFFDIESAMLAAKA